MHIMPIAHVIQWGSVYAATQGANVVYSSMAVSQQSEKEFNKIMEG
jgi:hypothetical protein